MAVTVGTLVIDLAANTASFSTEMGKASNLAAKSANDIKRSLEKIALAGAAMAAALVTGTAGVIRSALDQVDALGKAAQAAGTTAETLSTLQYAAKLSNVESEQLTKGLEKLSLAAFKAQGGNVQLGNIFKRLGVNIMDANGHLKDSGILLEEMAPKFANMADGAGKTALAQALLGKAGAGMIPLLNQYGAEQARVNDEAHRFGLVLSQSTVDVAMKAHDNLDRLTSVMKGMGFSLLSATLPALDQLLQKLIDIAAKANLQDLAKSYGEKVTTAVHALGDSLDFATQHATALKRALEALIALKLVAIAIPVLGDLNKGGAANVGKGIDKFTVGFLGLEKVLPVLKEFGGWLKYTTSFIGLLAAEEGVASAASYVLGGAFAAIGGPIGIAVAAIGGIVALLYTFRDATFSLGGTTYELRDTWNAAWLAMKDVVGVAVDFIKTRFEDIKVGWTAAVNWIKDNPIAQAMTFDFGGSAFEKWIASKLGVPDIANKYLDEARNQRLAANVPEGYTTGGNHPEHQDFGPPKKDQPDTSGLGKAKKDPYTDEIEKLTQAIEAQRAYLAVVNGTPEAIQAATAAEKANAVIVEINNKLHDEGRAKLTALQRATIEQKVATEESLKSLVDYGREVVGQEHSADLSIQQARVLAVANAEGDEAVRRATVDNAILGLTYSKTAEQIAKMAPELTKLRGLLTIKANIDLVDGINRDIFAIQQESAAQGILNAAILEGIDVQRKAEIEAKTYAINQQIAAASDDTARQALIAKRDLMVEQMKAQQAASDLSAADSELKSPQERYDDEIDSLTHLANALKGAQEGRLTFMQGLELASRAEDAFNKKTDETVNLLLHFGNASDGVHAFFLDMQKQAQSTGSIIYEAMHSAFDKISENLTQLVTGGKTSFAKMFEDIGRQMVNSEIKKQLQESLGKLGQRFPGLGGMLGTTETAKLDGSSPNNALWVRMASADGSELTNFGQPRTTNELTDLIGPNPKPAASAQQSVSQINQIAQHPPVDMKSALSDLPSFIKLLGGMSSQKSPFGESLGLPKTSLGMPKTNELDDLLGSGSNTDQKAGDSSGGGVASALSSILGGLGGMQGTPKGTASSPFYVKNTGGSSQGGLGNLFSGSGSSANDGSDGGDGTGDSGGGFFSNLFSKLGGLFKGGSSGDSSGGDSGSGGDSSFWSKLIPHAEGGPVSPSSAYLVGEKGPEILTGISGNITSNANSMRALSSGGGPTIHYSIDARGTDPALTEQRTRQAILAAHNSSVNQSLQASAERMKRVPNR
ncbi:MAG TPA: phage tail tape measure C-terminal domain-containing protein [Edaphobacter sp.]|nr:phage tail tape measure C-terminal domain-containing protein [Edaphobacter sp.]